MSLYDLAGHLAFALIMVSYLVKDLFTLRCLAIVASIAGIAYNYLVPPEPLWLVINWNVAFVAINGVQMELMRRERKGVHFSDRERELYDSLFTAFSQVEFMRLLRAGEWRSAGEGERLANEGEMLDDVMLIYDGRATVEARGEPVATLTSGEFVGEMSMIAGGAATATVTATAPTDYLAWSKAALERLLDRYPSMGFALQSVLSADLTRKLLREKEAARHENGTPVDGTASGSDRLVPGRRNRER